MKRLLFLLPFLALLLTAAAWGAISRATRVGACPERTRGVNGLPLREQAIVKDGVTYVPLRAVAESLGCQVTWDPRLGVLIWSNTPQLPTTPEAPNPNLTPGLPTPGLPRDPRPVIPQPPLPGRP